MPKKDYVNIAQVNAFTANSAGGNPAGVVLDAGNFSESQMLEIAKQVGFSETAFVSVGSGNTRRLRFFTTTDEVDLCGHATIASWSYLFQQGLISSGSYTQDTKAGLLKIEVGNNGLVYMEQAQAKFYKKIDTAKIAPALGINISDFHPDLMPQIVSTGLKDLLVPVASEAILNSITPDFDALTKLSREHDVTGLHVFALSDDSKSLASARNFAPLFGINEESATGTSNGALLCYLRKCGVLPDQKEFLIEQGKTMDQLSHIYGMFRGEKIWIGGMASTIKEFEVSFS